MSSCQAAHGDWHVVDLGANGAIRRDRIDETETGLLGRPTVHEWWLPSWDSLSGTTKRLEIRTRLDRGWGAELDSDATATMLGPVFDGDVAVVVPVPNGDRVRVELPQHG